MGTEKEKERWVEIKSAGREGKSEGEREMDKKESKKQFIEMFNINRKL